MTNAGAAAATLTTGGNNTSTTFSGVIQDGVGVTGLTKVGTGTFTLTGANTYTGGTTISAGTLQIGNGGTTGSDRRQHRSTTVRSLQPQRHADLWRRDQRHRLAHQERDAAR